MIERELTFPTLKPLPLGYRVVQLDSGHFLGIGPERNGRPNETGINVDRWAVRRWCFEDARLGVPRDRPILWSAPMVLALLAGRKTQTRRVLKQQPRHVRQFDGVWAGSNAVVNMFTPLKPFALVGDHLWGRETWAYNGQGSKNYGPKNKRREGYVTYAADNKRVTHHFGAGLMLPSPKQTVPQRLEDEDEYDFERRRSDYYTNYFERWRPSIFMPRWASRLLHEVTAVRVERLQDISEADAIAEGIEPVMHESWSVWDPACEATVSLMVEPSAGNIKQHGYEHVRHIGPKMLATARDRYETLWGAINGPDSWAKNPWVWVISFRPVTA